MDFRGHRAVRPGPVTDCRWARRDLVRHGLEAQLQCVLRESAPPGCSRRLKSVRKERNVGQAFEPDVRLESLTYVISSERSKGFPAVVATRISASEVIPIRNI